MEYILYSKVLKGKIISKEKPKMLKLFRKDKYLCDMTRLLSSLGRDAGFAPKNIYLTLAEPSCAEGDVVSVGDTVGLLADKSEVFSGVSGMVTEIVKLAGGSFEIKIENDFSEKVSEKCLPFGKRNNIKVTDLTPDMLIREIEAAGISARLKSVSGEPRSLSERIRAAFGKARQMVVICASCDPLDCAAEINAAEFAGDMISGMKILMSALKIGEGVVVLNSESAEQAQAISGHIKDADNIKALLVDLSYPCDNEHLVMYALTGVEISASRNAERVACVVFDEKEVLSIARAFLYGEKETSELVSLSGDLNDCANISIPYGTRFSEIISYCGSEGDGEKKIIVGGLLRGREVSADDTFEKGMSPISVLDEENIPAFDGERCIGCGRCAKFCPMMLMPMYLWRAKNKKTARLFDIDACIECGACQYVCPADIPILGNIKKLKGTDK